MEKIKIGKLEFELVTNGYRLGKEGGTLVFLPEERTFEEVENIMKQAESIYLIDGAGEIMESRHDLIFAGRMQKDNYYVISNNEQGKEILGTVMTADFRISDVREELDEINAKLDYVAMMTDVEV